MVTVDSLKGKKLPFEFLKEITKEFSMEISKGPLGTTVYKAILEDGEIAVKRHVANAPGTHNNTAYCTNAHKIMKHKHKNVVQLLAFCLEKRHKVWVPLEGGGFDIKDVVTESLFCYEFFSKGSLHHNLFVEKVSMDWKTRFEIIKGICKGVEFLHTRTQPIIHLNLKPQNIMLDGNMVPKIADFGYSRIIDPKQSRINTRSSVGSVGYMAPEYLLQHDSELSRRFDIYSLGLIIIEITIREKNCSGTDQRTARTFIDKVTESRTDKVLVTSDYPGLEEGHLEHQIACIDIGLQCVKLDQNARPKISKIINYLHDLL